jgi:hypothetical protein
LGAQREEVVAVAYIEIPIAVQVGNDHCDSGIKRPEPRIRFGKLKRHQPTSGQ